MNDINLLCDRVRVSARGMFVEFFVGDLIGWLRVLVFVVSAILVAQFPGVVLRVTHPAMDDRIFSHKERKEHKEGDTDERHQFAL